MKKLLLIIGIVLFIACGVFLLLAALKLSGYNNVMDGSPELYDKLHREIILNLIIGIVAGLIAAVCMILRAKI